jgi:MerR family copper efflux transcriptional regulator
MQIGIVAKRIGLSVDAIRFYERNGLLPRPLRTEGGFRRYGENDVETLAFVRRVQGLGFKLSEIRGLMRLRGDRLQPCAPVQRRLQEKLADVRRKLRTFTNWSTSCAWLCAVATENCASGTLIVRF